MDLKPLNFSNFKSIYHLQVVEKNRAINAFQSILRKRFIFQTYNIAFFRRNSLLVKFYYNVLFLKLLEQIF